MDIYLEPRESFACALCTGVSPPPERYVKEQKRTETEEEGYVLYKTSSTISILPDGTRHGPFSYSREPMSLLNVWELYSWATGNYKFGKLHGLFEFSQNCMPFFGYGHASSRKIMFSDGSGTTEEGEMTFDWRGYPETLDGQRVVFGSTYVLVGDDRYIIEKFVLRDSSSAYSHMFDFLEPFGRLVCTYHEKDKNMRIILPIFSSEWRDI